LEPSPRPPSCAEAAAQEGPFRVKYYPVTAGMGSRDTAPAPDGTIWFCGQRNGTLGRLDPRDGSSKLVDLGKGAAPHGVIIGPDGAPWVTEGGQNAIARVDPGDHKVTLFRLPETEAYANLNTAVFDKSGIYWFTGQSGIYGRLDPKSGDMTVFKSPRGRGTYGMTITPKGDIWYASLAGNHIARIDPRPATRPWSSRRRPIKAHGGCGRIPRVGSGSANGTAAMCRCTIPPTAPGRHGSCPAAIRAPMPSMSTTRTRSGSLISAPTRSCASTP
jgi:streptogramin lyase